MNLELHRPFRHSPQAITYEAPAIESIATSEELDREVAYAAVNGVSPPPES